LTPAQFFWLMVLITYCLLPTANGQQTQDFARWVNPFIGTGGHGHTFPGATMPFGMVQLSPDTRTDNWDGSSGYHYSDDTIYGFSHTHLSGTGIPDYCDILLMPTADSGKAFSKLSPAGFTSTFSHDDEKAEPGYYSVRLDDGNLLAELTSTARVGLHRYTFPASKSAGIFLDLRWRDKVLDTDVKAVTDRRIEGFRRSSSWAKDQVIYFVAEFSKPFKGYGFGGPSTLPNEHTDGLFFGFDTKDGEQILVKVALSAVSIEGARKNLAAELPGWNFEKVRADARAAWNKELSKIEVSGGTPDQTTTFYTALYHTMIQPNIFNDVDGSYLGHDGKIHNIKNDGVRSPSADMQKPARQQGRSAQLSGKARPSDNYTVFSLWDTFRAAHPLYTIIDQKRTVDFINTFIRIYEQGGRLPVWELAGNETDCMIGYHAVSVIADTMAKGIKGFDYEKAYKAAKHSAELDHFGLAAYKRRGFISMEDENESVSKTLEYAYDDWCIAQMAKILLQREPRPDQNGRKPWIDASGTAYFPIDIERTNLRKEFIHYLARAQSFENLFDPTTGFMRPKTNGGFVEPFAPNEVTFGFTEGNSWQYSFFVPQDISRLIELEGGSEKFAAKLDELFTTDQKLAGREQADLTGLIGQYAHGNEPSHHIAYLYNYAGQPWKTQRYVRQIMVEFYKNAPDGLIGNEDCGQMSAWYVLSATGLYQVTPGSPYFDVGTPLFPLVKYHLENGKTFTVRADGVSSKTGFVASARLNGINLQVPVLPYADVQTGGTLEFVMTDKPSKNSFAKFDVRPSRDLAPSVPIIDGPGKTFNKQASISLRTIDTDVQLYYSTTAKEPITPYTGPITINQDTTIVAKAVDGKGRSSVFATANFHKQPNDWTVKVISGYSRQYTGGGDNAIVDGIRGTTNFASGEWQGVQGKPYEAIIDLQRMTEIHEVGGSFLQVAGPWIWMPERIDFEVSSDGVNFMPVAEIRPNFPRREMTPTIKEYKEPIAATKARFVRVRAYNIGKIPDWHPGAGGDPWIFVDEIFID
jgi:putative alpha-1,2-mannosidase